MSKRRKRQGAGPVTPARRERRVTRSAVVVIIGVLATAAAAAIVAWRQRPSPSAAAPVRDNILLVTLDTTRADHLGAYGYARGRTQHLDRLAAEGVRFDRAFSPAPITLPAHASIFTGLYPFEHGVRNNGNFYLPDRFDTLATNLSRAGYRTAAFVSTFILDRRYGLARGFDQYDDRMQGADAQVVSLEAERRGDRTALALSAWLDAHAAGGPPFFAWLHLYDPHEPYRAPQPFRDAFADSPYDGEISFTDAIVASILDKLAQLGVADRTIVALIGDHGESLGDHGEETHSMFVYDAAIHVPLILWRPGRLPAGRVVNAVVRATDLAPTLLDLVGAPPLATPNGRSLLPVILGADRGEPPPIYAETYLPQFYLNWAPLRTLRDERWKFIDAPRPELYDLSRDPGEAHDVSNAQPRTADGMRAALTELTGGSEGAMHAGSLDREVVEKLASLGYVGAGAGTAAPDAATERRDPKDVIALFNLLRRANNAVRERRFADALPVLQQVLDQDPRNAFARLVLGSAYMGMEQYPRAIAEYRRYLQIVPTSSYAHQWMAICYVRMGDQAGALRETEAALAIDPRYSDARVLRGGILASRGDYTGSIGELRKAVETDPAKPTVRLDLAKVLDEAGRKGEARREYETILKANPDYAPALTGLGVLQAQDGRFEEAAALFRKALALDPSSDGTRLNLARMLDRQGRTADATAEYRRLVDDPRTTHAVREAAATALNAKR